jgi:hypothetical protein
MHLRFEEIDRDRLAFYYAKQVFLMKKVSSNFIKEEIIAVCLNYSSKQVQ